MLKVIYKCLKSNSIFNPCFFPNLTIFLTFSRSSKNRIFAKNNCDELYFS